MKRRVVGCGILWVVAGPAWAGGLAGQVVDEAGVGIPGVTIIAYDQRLNYALATTTNDGTWEMELVPDGFYRVRASPSDDSGFVDRFYPSTWDYCQAERVEVTDMARTDGIDFTLAVGGTLTGRLVGTAGEPLAGALVVLEGLSARTSLGLRQTVSGDDGVFEAVGLDADPGSPEAWRCYVDAPGHPQEYLGPTYVDDDATSFEVPLGEIVDVGDQPLLDGIRVSGVARGPDGPVNGGTAYVFSTSQAMATTIGSDGVYVADGLPPGNVISWAESPGFATTYYPDADRPGASVPALEEGTDLTGVDLSLPVESSLTVQLVGEGGDVGDVSVMLYNSTYTVARGSPVDDDGRVTIGGLFPGDYTLYVYGADAGFEEGLVLDDAGEPVVFQVDGATDVEVPLAPAASISGHVLDDAGRPVYGAYVSAVPTNGDSAQSAQSDANGVYTIPGLVAGTYTLTSQYVAYCPNDPGYVQVWWQDALQPETAASFVVAAGTPYPDTDLVLPVDGDHDHMGDAWETENGLDPGRDDSAEDADGDGFSNIEEYLLGTDPTAGAGKDDGCGGCGGSSAGALLLVVGWGVGRRRRVTPSA